MKLYRFSPIKNETELREAIEYIHFACYKLCKKSFGKYLPNAGNVGVFCHYEDEFENLVKIRQELAKPSDDPNQKYFELYKPIVIAGNDGVPQAVYTHLYMRKPDIYRSQVGDIDFYLDQNEYRELKQSLIDGAITPGARIFPRQDLDMIELYDPDVDALAYVSTNDISQKVRIKLSDETNL